jgi:hypothetical protein
MECDGGGHKFPRCSLLDPLPPGRLRFLMLLPPSTLIGPGTKHLAPSLCGEGETMEKSHSKHNNIYVWIHPILLLVVPNSSSCQVSSCHGCWWPWSHCWVTRSWWLMSGPNTDSMHPRTYCMPSSSLVFCSQLSSPLKAGLYVFHPVVHHLSCLCSPGVPHHIWLCVLLMGCDYCVATFHPLHYNVLMNPQRCAQFGGLVLQPWRWRWH